MAQSISIDNKILENILVQLERLTQEIKTLKTKISRIEPSYGDENGGKKKP